MLHHTLSPKHSSTPYSLNGNKREILLPSLTHTHLDTAVLYMRNETIHACFEVLSDISLYYPQMRQILWEKLEEEDEFTKKYKEPFVKKVKEMCLS